MVQHSLKLRSFFPWPLGGTFMLAEEGEDLTPRMHNPVQVDELAPRVEGYRLIRKVHPGKHSFS